MFAFLMFLYPVADLFRVMERTIVMKAFANAVCILLLCGSIFAVGPLAVDDLHLTAVNTSRICYPLVNDSDADGDSLSLQSFDSTSTGGETITDILRVLA